MGDAHRRRKQPDLTRRHLLDVTATLALEAGVSTLTLESVARAAGVSKGGLLHHFPSKQALIEALFDDLAGRFRQAVDQEIADDPDERARTARAYLRAVAGQPADEDEAKLWGVLTIAILAEPSLRGRWRSWLDEHLEADKAEATPPVEAMIGRLAADGLWLADLFGFYDIEPELRTEIVERLSVIMKHPRAG
ncbi:TetR/AcrR family transcriptional regulator [Rhodospirillaceae bacterium SYSU D60014]|uniref:TetR/AcrR family transcriptional regulator n=1 Tax=Virgifigura deserti TaxID=2268457 RepID=UPI000E671C63